MHALSLCSNSKLASCCLTSAARTPLACLAKCLWVLAAPPPLLTGVLDQVRLLSHPPAVLPRGCGTHPVGLPGESRQQVQALHPAAAVGAHGLLCAGEHSQCLLSGCDTDFGGYLILDRPWCQRQYANIITQAGVCCCSGMDAPHLYGAAFPHMLQYFLVV